MKLAFARGISVVILLGCFGLLSGCATYRRIADYPGPKGPTPVTIKATPLSKMTELPTGTFYDAERGIVISGHQKGNVAGLLFGVVGVLVVDQVNKGSAERRFGDAAHGSALNLTQLAEQVLAQEIAAGRVSQVTLASVPQAVEVTPYAVFLVMKSGQARLYTMLKAETKNAKGEATWSVRYFARAPGEHLIEGTDGWMTGNRFDDGMLQGLKATYRLLERDLQGNMAVKRKVLAKGVFPFLNDSFAFELRFLVVDETEEQLIGRLAVGDALVLAGTHVLNKADYEIKDATFDDPRGK